MDDSYQRWSKRKRKRRKEFKFIGVHVGDHFFFLSLTCTPNLHLDTLHLLTIINHDTQGVAEMYFGSSKVVSFLSMLSPEWPDKQPRRGWTSREHSLLLGQLGVQLNNGGVKHHHHCQRYCQLYSYQYIYNLCSTLTSSLTLLSSHHILLGILFIS